MSSVALLYTLSTLHADRALTETVAKKAHADLCSDYVRSVAFSPDGKTVAASASDDNTVKVWSVADGQCQQTLEGHSGAVASVSFSPDGKTLASAGDKTVRIFNLEDGTCQKVLKGHR